MKIFLKNKITNQNLSKFKAGFSLIELVVSLGIIAVITVLFMANYRTGNKRTDLIMTAQKIVADIHMAQNNALGLVKYNGLVPAGGWGIAFNKTNQYTMFADLNQPNTGGYMDYDSATEGNINYGARVTDISPGVFISSLKIDSSGPNLDTANVTFLPPDPITNIYHAGATSTVLEITVTELGNTNNNKTIRVNFLGLVEVID
ncbi:MAG: prepilin-type N-terminal cleavage/methylation domain-containing protein [Patescibacteria group bacterium]